MKKLLLTLFLNLSVIACSNQYTTNGEHHYMRSKNGPKLVIPPPLTDNDISDFYDLPMQNQNPKVSVYPGPN